MAEKQMGSHNLWITRYRLEIMGYILEVGYHSLQIIISRSYIIVWGCRFQNKGLQIIGCRLQNIDQGLEVIGYRLQILEYRVGVRGYRLQIIDQGLESIQGLESQMLQIRDFRLGLDQGLEVRGYRVWIVDQGLESIHYRFQVIDYRSQARLSEVALSLDPCSLQESLVF